MTATRIDIPNTNSDEQLVVMTGLRSIERWTTTIVTATVTLS
jgi:hypothetical protein